MGNLIEHKRVNINPTGDELEGIPMRGNDAPLFWTEKMKDGLGIEVQEVYNRCMSLLYYRPVPLKTKDEYASLRGELDKLEEKTIELIKKVKKLKEAYSQTWKDNFHKYPHLKTKLSEKYDDKDPFDDTWMAHDNLRESIEMQEAAAIYMQAVEIILVKFDVTLQKIEKCLKTYITQESATITLDEWLDLSSREIATELEQVIQPAVDKILSTNWGPVASAMTGASFAGAKPSYIGSTMTGKKSVTKGYVQFNPKDYDVDGQMVSSDFYTEIAQWAEIAPRTPATKNRYFVRLAAQPIIDKIESVLVEDSKKDSSEQFSDTEKTHMNRLVATLKALIKYVDVVEKALVSTMDGVIADPADPFDLAIVRETID